MDDQGCCVRERAHHREGSGGFLTKADEVGDDERSENWSPEIEPRGKVTMVFDLRCDDVGDWLGAADRGAGNLVGTHLGEHGWREGTGAGVSNDVARIGHD